MNRKRRFGPLPLVILPLLLAAAASPSVDCPTGANAAPPLPVPLELARQPEVSAELTANSFAAQLFAGLPGCRAPFPAIPLGATLRSESSDVLHGLPNPDILRPIDEQNPAPQFH
jgi:hypothetical protein